MEPPPPAVLCLRCRALTDGGPCDCARDARPVRLDDPAAEQTIEEAIHVKPERDTADVVLRLVVGVVVGPGLVAAAFALLVPVAMLLLPDLEHDAVYVFGAPLGLATLGWSAFVVSTTLRQPGFYTAVDPPERAEGERMELRLAHGVVLHGAEMRTPRNDHQVILRDAWASEPFVLRRTGERIELPAGRLRVDVAPARWRRGDGILTRSWRRLPGDLRRGGLRRSLSLDEGDAVWLVGAELEEVGQVEGGFRTSADRRFRFVGERPVIEVEA